MAHSLALTLPELKDRLKVKDLDELLDLLEIDSEKLVELASDEIEERYDELAEQLTEEWLEWCDDNYRS